MSAKATFRLHPMPAVERTCLASLDSVDAARDVVTRFLDSPLVPFAVELLNPEASRRVAEQAGLPWPKARCGLAVAIGSIRPEAVDAQLETVRRLCREAGAAEGHVLEGQVHDAFWRATRDFALGDGLQVVLKASVVLTKVADAVGVGEEVAAKQALRLGVVSEAATGIIRDHLTGEAAPDERVRQGVAEAVNRLRAFAQEAEGNVVVLDAPPAVKSRVDVWGLAEKALPVIRRPEAAVGA